MYFALGGTSLAWDILIIIMPFPILKRLKLDKRSKVSYISPSAHSFPKLIQGLDCASLALRSRLLRYDCSRHPYPNHRRPSHLHRLASHHRMVDRGDERWRNYHLRARLSTSATWSWPKDYVLSKHKAYLFPPTKQ